MKIKEAIQKFKLGLIVLYRDNKNFDYCLTKILQESRPKKEFNSLADNYYWTDNKAERWVASKFNNSVGNKTVVNISDIIDKFIVRFNSIQDLSYSIYNTEMEAIQYIDEWNDCSNKSESLAIDKAKELNLKYKF